MQDWEWEAGWWLGGTLPRCLVSHQPVACCEQSSCCLAVLGSACNYVLVISFYTNSQSLSSALSLDPVFSKRGKKSKSLIGILFIVYKIEG